MTRVSVKGEMYTSVRVENYNQSEVEMCKRVSVMTSGCVNPQRESVLKRAKDSMLQIITRVSVKAITTSRVVNL